MPRIKTTLPSRIGESIGAFSQDDKFETCLNLAPFIAIQALCRTCPTWADVLNSQDRSSWLSPEAIASFEAHGYTPDLVSKMRVSPLLPAKFHQRVLSRSTLSPNVNPTAYREMTRTTGYITKHGLYLQFSHLASCAQGTLLRRAFAGYNEWPRRIDELPNQVLNAFAVAEELQLVLNATKTMQGFIHGSNPAERAAKRRKKEDSVIRLQTLGAECYVLKDFVVLDYDRESWLVPHAYFLEIYNKATEMSCLLLYLHASTGTCMPDTHWDQSLTFLSWCVQHLLKRREVKNIPITDLTELYMDNSGFLTMKTMEALGVGFMTRREDKEAFNVENRLLLDTMWASLTEEGLTDYPDIEDSALYQIMDEMETAQISDLMGVVKVFGHPAIDIVGGLTRLHERVHQKLRIDDVALKRCLGLMKRDLMFNYYKRHHMFPVVVPETMPSTLKKLVDAEADVTQGRAEMLFRSITLEDWANLQFKQNATFDRADRQFALIKDKAIGLTRSAVLKRFLLPITERSRTKPQDRRALLAFLLTPDFTDDFQEYLSSYMQGDDFDDTVLEYLVIKLTAKELELKDLGRYFGSSPMEERMRRQVQERNVMQFMAKYMPDQILTTNELDSIHKLIAFRKLTPSYPDHSLIHVSADFSSWNNNFRRDTVDRTSGAVLDAWFGLPSFYKKTMLAFERMLVYYDDGNYRVKWDGQEGGIEGLNQATWMLMFTAGLKESLEKIGFKYHMTVKGDDVRMSLLVPNAELRESGFVRLRQRILNELKQKCADLGWQLNPNESFVSLSLICTSKQYIVLDSWLPCAIKKMLKCAAVTNVVFPTVTDHISTCYSVAHSAASQATVALPCYVVASYMANRLLVREMEGYRLTKDQLLVLSLWPQVLGGPGALPLQTFFVRGENDIVSCALSLFRALDISILNTIGESELDPDNIRSYIRNILNQQLEPEPTYRQLLLDPYALCISHPVRPATILKRCVLENLKLHCLHPDVQDLLTAEASDFDEALAEALMSITPCCPKVMSAIWEASPTYLLTELVSKFLQSQSIITFLMLKRSRKGFSGQKPQVLGQMIKAHKELKRYWSETMRRTADSELLLFGSPCPSWTDRMVCSSEITHGVRERCWGRKLYAITYPSLVDQLIIWDPSDDNMRRLTDADSVGHIIKILVKHRTAVSQIYSTSHHYSAEPSCKAWLGSKTASHMDFADWPAEAHTESALRLHKLLTVLAASHNLDENIQKMIKQVMRTMTRINPESVCKLRPGTQDGNFFHRIATHHYSTVTMPNYRPNIANMVAINMNDCRETQRSSQRRTINYAAAHYFLVVLATLPLQSSQRLEPDYPDLIYACLDFDKGAMNEGTYKLCTGCCGIIDDVPLSMPKRSALPIYGLLHLTSLKCTPAEEKSLQTAIQARLSQRVLNPYTVLQLSANLRCPPNLAVQILMSRLKEYSTGTYTTLVQLGIRVPPDNEIVQDMCTAMGISPPPTQRVNLDVIAHKDPELVAIACLVEMYGLFVEVVGRAEPTVWSDSGITMGNLYKRRVCTLLTQIQGHGLIRLIVNRVNGIITTSVKIPDVAYSADFCDELGLHLFRAFAFRIDEWGRYLAMDIMPTMTIEGASCELYRTKAALILDNARLFARYLLFHQRSLYEWIQWFERLFALTEDFTREYEHLPLEIRSPMRTPITVDLAIIVALTYTNWFPSSITLDNLREAIEDQQENVLITSQFIAESLELPGAGLYDVMHEQLTHIIHAVKPEWIDRDQVKRACNTLIDVAYDILETYHGSEHNPIPGRIELLYGNIEWYLTRTPTNSTTDSLELFVQSLPQVPVDHDLVEDAEIPIYPFFRSRSPTLRQFVLQQAPSAASCTPAAMKEFVTETHALCLQLAIQACPDRRSGPLSSCEIHQHSIFHWVNYSSIAWRVTNHASMLLSLGNMSGYLSKVLLTHYPRDSVVHLSIPTIDTPQGSVQVHGRRTAMPPADLEQLSLHPALSRRLHVFNGPDGDITSHTAMNGSNLRSVLALAPVKAVFCCMMGINPEHQDSVLSSVVSLMVRCRALGAPLLLIWRVNAVNLNTVARALSLGTVTAVDISGTESCVTPCLHVTVTITSPRAVGIKLPTLPLALQSDILALLREASRDEEGRPREASLALLDLYPAHIATPFAALVPYSQLITAFRPTCLCRLARDLATQVEPGNKFELTRVMDQCSVPGKTQEDLLNGLCTLAALCEVMGLCHALKSGQSEFFYDTACDQVREMYTNLCTPWLNANPAATFLTVREYTVDKVTVYHHRFVLSARHIILQVSQSRVDLLHHYNLGVGMGLELITLVTAILSCPTDRLDDQDAALRRFHDTATIEKCCRAHTTDTLHTGLVCTRSNVRHWMDLQLASQRVSGLRPASPLPPDLMVDPRTPERPGSSPHYEIHSPVLGPGSHQVSSEHGPASPEYVALVDYDISTDDEEPRSPSPS